MYIIDKTSSNSLGVKEPPWGGRGEGQIRTLGYLGYVYSRNADIPKRNIVTIRVYMYMYKMAVTDIKSRKMVIQWVLTGD